MLFNNFNLDSNIVEINNSNKVEVKSILKTKYAALLMFHGSPKELGDINIFLSNILKNKIPVVQKTTIMNTIIKRYKETGGSPLTFNMSSIANIMCNEYNIPTYIGARYSDPYIHDTIDKIIKDGYTSIIIIYMSPYYNHTFVFNEYIKLVQDYILKIKTPVRCYIIHSWYNYKLFHQIWFNNIKKMQLKLSRLHIKEVKFLFCAHGLPQNMVSYKDLYLSQINSSVNYLTKELKCSPTQCGISFQNSNDHKWLQPSIFNNTIFKNNVVKSVIVIPIGFISNNFDILYDIDIQLKKALAEKKIFLYKTVMPVSNINFINLITLLYRRAVACITLKYL